MTSVRSLFALLVLQALFLAALTEQQTAEPLEIANKEISNDEIIELSAVALARLIREGRATSIQVVSAFLERGRQLNRLGLNAVIDSNDISECTEDHDQGADVEFASTTTTRNARSRARELDRWQAQHNSTIGPLHGVPISVKDHIGVSGMIQAFGLARYRDYRPTRHSTVVDRLIKAGAIVLYKGNMPELGLSFDTWNPTWGRTANPYDLLRSSGGSSGGDGALVAARAVPLAIGSDVGGSLRVPASWNGLCALKPTQGRLPATGASVPELGEVWELFEGFNDCLVLGPMSRYVEDLELVLQIASGSDYVDVQAQMPPYNGQTSNVDLKSLRIGYFTAHGDNRASPDVIRAVHATVEALQALGVTAMTNIDVMPLIANVSSFIGRLVARGGCTRTLDLIDYGRVPVSPSLLPLVEICSAWKMDNREDYDALRMTIARYRSQLLQFFANYDLLIGPTTAMPAPYPLDITDPESIGSFAYTIGWNVGQMPVLALGPVLLAEEEKYRGLPVGVSAIVAPHQEHIALAVGLQLQQVIPMSSFAPAFQNADQVASVV